ncbi:MAG: PD40 domain-containing protein [Acidobacteria bacterium]|nr:PD40 domain-containing protein [Acidobacteriota bacterium]
MSSEVNNLYEFGEFRLDIEKCLLWRGDELVALSPKALELLCLLVRRHGDVVSKQEIFDTVWAGTFVEEGVLTQNVYTLRQTLGLNEKGGPFIENIARRGYRFSIPVALLQTGEFRPAAPPPDSEGREYVIATQTRTELIEEFYEDEPAPSGLAGKKSFFRRRSAVFFSFGLIFVVIGGFFAFRAIRPRAWAFFHPPLENVEFQKLTDSGRVGAAALSPDGNFLAFTKEKKLFLKDVSSGRDIQLDVPGIDEFGALAFSPTGESIFFRNNLPRRLGNIYQVSRFGGETRLVAEKTWIGFGLAPDGKRIAFIRSNPELNRQTLFVKNLENGEERELLSKAYPDFFYYKAVPAWSPDGKRIAFIVNAGPERSTRLLTADAETGREEEIKAPRLRQFQNVAWLPDGATLVVSASDLGRRFQLWKLSYPGGDAQRITNGLNSFETVSVSNDGRKIVALQTSESSNLWVSDASDVNNQKPLTTGNSNNVGQTSLNWAGGDRLVYAASDEKNAFANLWTLNLADNSRRPLTSNTDFHSDFACVSADGKTIFFNANRSRAINVWRMDATGENLTPVTNVSGGLPLYPVVSPDNRFLYYLFRTPDASVIKRLDLAGSREEDFVNDPKLSPAAFLSLSGDGRFLAFLNMRSDNDADDAAGGPQFAVVATDNPADVKLVQAKGVGTLARLSADGRFLDFAAPTEGGMRILRQAVAGGEPAEVFAVQKERIFNFAWSADGGKLAVSRGHQYNDAILLTGFE